VPIGHKSNINLSSIGYQSAINHIIDSVTNRLSIGYQSATRLVTDFGGNRLSISHPID
jgi:hypothetical protein